MLTLIRVKQGQIGMCFFRNRRERARRTEEEPRTPHAAAATDTLRSWDACQHMDLRMRRGREGGREKEQTDP